MFTYIYIYIFKYHIYIYTVHIYIYIYNPNDNIPRTWTVMFAGVGRGGTNTAAVRESSLGKNAFMPQKDGWKLVTNPYCICIICIVCLHICRYV